AARKDQCEVRGVAPRAGRALARRRQGERALRRDVTNRTHGPLLQTEGVSPPPAAPAAAPRRRAAGTTSPRRSACPRPRRAGSPMTRSPPSRRSAPRSTPRSPPPRRAGSPSRGSRWRGARRSPRPAPASPRPTARSLGSRCRSLAPPQPQWRGLARRPARLRAPRRLPFFRAPLYLFGQLGKLCSALIEHLLMPPGQVRDGGVASHRVFRPRRERRGDVEDLGRIVRGGAYQLGLICRALGEVLAGRR